MSKSTIKPLPDRRAQSLWRKVDDASDVIDDLVTDMNADTVRGEETRRELGAVLGLLEEAAALLKLTANRETARRKEALSAGFANFWRHHYSTYPKRG